jgi:hypothetical protein
MPKRCGGKRGPRQASRAIVKRILPACIHMAVLCAAPCVHAQAGELRFEQVFDTGSAAAALHYQASYRAGGAMHRVEAWRDGDLRIRRRTDDRIEVHASRGAGSAEFVMSILDLDKRIHTSVSRSNLYRIGSFTDWFDLAHGLRHPKGAYGLRGIAAPAGAPAPLQPCAWYELAQNGQASRICWSALDQAPMLILSGAGEVVWRVTALDRGPIAPDTFVIRDEGYLRNDADQDIEPD